MKHILSFLISLLLLLSLCACGSGDNTTPCAHNYDDGICTLCGAEDLRTPFSGNNWTAHIVRPSDYGEAEMGEILSVYTLSPTDFQGYSHKDFYANESYSETYYGTTVYNGKTYYDFWFSSNMNGITWEDNGDTVTVTFMYPEISLTLERTGNRQFTVIVGTEDIPTGTVFDCPESTEE